MWQRSTKLLVCAVGLLLLDLFSISVTAQTNVTDPILFFYSPVVDECEWGPSNSFSATNNTVNGGVCAYIPAKDRLYACAAPYPTCWTWNQNCKSGTDTAGSDQILCGDSNANQWCCASYETCTVIPGQINVCVGTFASPNSGVNPIDAASKQYNALPSKSIGTIVPDSTPSVFSTRMGSTSTSSSSSSLSTIASTGTGTRTATGTAMGATSGITTATPTGNTDNKGLTGGATVGIAVGVVGAVAIVAVVIILLVLHRQKRLSLQGVGKADMTGERFKEPRYLPKEPLELPSTVMTSELPS